MLIVANWKMNGDAAFLARWAEKFKTPQIPVDIIICPPTPYLPAARALLPETVLLGAQNVARWADDGAYTGEISAQMLVDCGCTHVIVGHSERRRLLAESDDDCAAKLSAAVNSGLSPILCIGESATARAAGEVESVIAEQLGNALQAAADSVFAALTIAYEPLWAIGTNVIPTMEEIGDINRYIRSVLISYKPAFGDKITILYGGSVHERNVADILSCPETGGVLVGGASLKADIFTDICRQTVN